MMKKRIVALLMALLMVLQMAPVALASEAAPAEEVLVEQAAPAEKEEAPAVKEEAPAVKEEAPAVKEEAPAVKEEAPAAKEEAPAAEDIPAEEEAPVKEDEPAPEEEAEKEFAAVFSDEVEGDKYAAVWFLAPDEEGNPAVAKSSLVEIGSQLGELPEAPLPKEDEFFLGWQYGDALVDAETVVEGNMELTAAYAELFPAFAETRALDDGSGITVNVTAPKGALPYGVEMLVSPVSGEDVRDTLEDSMGRLGKIVAVDISFVDSEGNEVQPDPEAGKVNVQMSAPVANNVRKAAFAHIHEGEVADDPLYVTRAVSAPSAQPAPAQPTTRRLMKAAPAKAAPAPQVETISFSYDTDSFSVFAIAIVTEYVASNGEVYEVTVTYGADADIPEGTELHVSEYPDTHAEYKKALRAWIADQLAHGVNEEELVLPGFIALDISLEYNGEPIEPSAPVQVDMKIKSLNGSKDFSDVEDIQIQHHVKIEGSDKVVLETVATSLEASFNLDTDEAVVKNRIAVNPDKVDLDAYLEPKGLDAAFSVESFSTFTVTWRNNQRTITVHYVDENGNELDISNPANTYPDMNAQSSSPAYLIYDIDGYLYDHTYRNTDTNANRIIPELNKNNNNWRYSTNGNTWTEFSNGDNIYVVYTKKPAPSQGGTPEIDEEEEWPEGNDAPQFSKSSSNQGDGTNLIKLSIVAAEKPVEKSTPADVIVIFDRSYSMAAYNMAGQQSGTRRLAVAKQAVNEMADILLNGDNKEIQMALVTFGTDVQSYSFTNNYGTFSSRVNNIDAPSSERTNWDKALRVANEMPVRSNAATFVIFVTDGDPTVREARGDLTNQQLGSAGMSNDYYRNNSLFGNGQPSQEANVQACYAPAPDVVKEIAAKNKAFYAVGVSNDVSRMNQLMSDSGQPADHAFICTDEEAMQEAFQSITEAIQSALGFGDVAITDGITELTHSEMKVMEHVDPDSFQYYRWGGEGNKYGADEAHMTEWTSRAADGCGAATYENDVVHWNMGDGFQLENGVHYVVTFRVWPSQEAYDLVADLNNGIRTYESLSAEEKAQVVRNNTDPVTYALKTNTNQVNATYKKTTKTGEEVVIADNTPIEATYHEGTIENMALTSMPLTIRKEFEDDLTAGEDRDTEVILTLYRRNAHQDPEADFEVYPVPQAGGTTSPNIVLNEGNGWSYTLYVAPGFESHGEVLEHGYDFTLSEPGIDYHYELVEEIINPMVVDGVDSYYGDGYLIDDAQTVEQYVDQSLTGVNRVKSGIDIKKIVWDSEENEISPDTEFTITGWLRDADGNPFTWHSGDDVNNSGAYHKFTPDPEGEFTFDGIKYKRTIYKGHFASTNSISFTLKAGEFVRFINVPDGCTFQFTEPAEVGNYKWENTEAKTQHRTSPDGPFTTEGDTQPSVSGQTASLGGSGVVGNKQYTITYTNKRTVELPEIELVKVDADDETKLNDATFAVYKDAAKTEQVMVNANGDDISALVTGNKEGSTGPDGWAMIGKLEPGTYYLYETEAPEGYVEPDEDATPIIITVTKQSNDTVTVTATKDGASVISGPTDGVYTITAENTHEKGDLIVSKTVTNGGAGYATKEFPFTVTLKDASEAALTGTLTLTAIDQDEQEKTVTFTDGVATFSLKDGESLTIQGIPTGYTYTVSEDLSGNDLKGYSQVTPANGAAATGEITKEPTAEAAFTNTYSMTPTEAEIPAEKILSVPAGLTPADITGKFTFTLAAGTNTAAGSIDTPLPTVTSYTNPDADGGSVTFGKITYNAPGVYNYTITESGEVDGITNDSEGATGKAVTVTVTDNGDGTLKAEVSPATGVSFTNAYDVEPTTVSFPVEKVLSKPAEITSDPVDITGKYTFTLTAGKNTAAGGIDTPMPTTTSYTNPDADGGTVTFGTISYSVPGTYEYTVTETGSVDGITNDSTTAKTVKVTVIDNGDGTLTATADSTPDKPLQFTNTIDTVKVTLKKIVTGNMGDWNKPFTFKVTVTGSNGKPVVITGVTDANGQWTGTLKHNETHVFEKLPVGATVEIVESDADGYKTTVEGTESLTYTFTVPDKDCTVNYTNNKEVEIDTGIPTESKPYFLLLGLIPLAGAALVLGARRRRKNEV